MDQEHQIDDDTPSEVLLRARKLADAAALELLLDRRADWLTVPPAYDAIIGRHLLRAGDAGSALYYLTSARDDYGDKMPPEQRRDLGVALFQLGRIEAAGRELSLVEQAGAVVSRPAYRAAIEAYAHRAGEALDQPPPTPYRIVAQAEALADTKDFVAARQLLEKSRARYKRKWTEIPLSYHAILGRVSLRSGDRDAAIEHLTHARDNSPHDVPANIRQPLGTALFEIGRFAEAGRELDLALHAGATIARAELLIAINSHRQRTGNTDLLDVRFARNMTVVDPDRRLVFVALAKNACSLLKATLILNSRYREEYLASGQTIHEFCSALAAGARQSVAVSEPGHFRFVVLRDPLRRTLSAYLEKFVRGRQSDDPYTAMQVARTVRAAQAALDIPADPERSISFEEFVRYLAVAEDVQCDMHWMPQVNLVGADLEIYDHVGTVERLDRTLDLLASRFCFVPESSLDRHLRKGDRHITRFSETVQMKSPARALPAELASLPDGVPMPELFLTRTLKTLLRRRFAADVALHASVMK
jgi:tetratricopeptide (TPR) repeat protein